MINKKFIAILVVAVVILGGIQLLQHNSRQQRTSRSSSQAVLIDSYGEEDLSRLVFGQGAEPEAVVLVRESDGWTVENVYGHRADLTKITGLLRALDGLKGEYRSGNESVLADYGLGEDRAVRLTGWRDEQAEPVLDLLVGEQPQGARGNFVRRAGSNEVYLTAAAILSPLGIYGGPDVPKTKQFLDLQAHKVEGADIDAIVLVDGDRVVTVEKEFTAPEMPADAASEGSPEDVATATPPIDRTVFEWKLTTPVRRTALKTKVDALQNYVAGIRAMDVADPSVDPADYGLAEPGKRIDIALRDGTQAIILIGDERPEAEGRQAGYYMQVAGDPTVWLITTYQIDNIFKEYTELLPADEE